MGTELQEACVWVTDGASPAERKVRILLHVVPRASRTQVVGLHGGRVKLQVAAPPVDGAANDAIVRWAAGVLGVPRAAVTLSAGSTSKKKAIEIIGLSRDEVVARLGR